MSCSKKYRAQVISISTRAAKGVWEDTSGPLIVEKLNSLAIECFAPVVIADGEIVETTLRKAVDEGIDLLITTGGTGHTPNDLTPEMTKRVIERESPGISEAIRNYGISQGILTSSLSRAIAGIANKTLIINLPGSSGGVKDGLKVLEGILLHALDQIHGGDHVRKD
jgi:molybdenum cofactor synthesis domain-containing protein